MGTMTSCLAASVPRGWHRVVAVDAVYYVSPDQRVLWNKRDVLKHLTSWGTCKCGLQCPVDIDKVFNFDLSVPTGGELTCTGSCDRGRRDRQQEPDQPVQQGTVSYDQLKVNGIVSHDVQEVNNTVSHDQQELDRNVSHDQQELDKTDIQEVTMPNHHPHVNTFSSHEVDNLSRDLDVQTGTNVTVWTQISSHDVQEIKSKPPDGGQGGSCNDLDTLSQEADNVLDSSTQRKSNSDIEMDEITVGSLNLDKYVAESREKQIIEGVKLTLLSSQVDRTDLHGVQQSSEEDKNVDKTQDDPLHGMQVLKAAEETCTQYLSHTQTMTASRSVIQLVDYGYDADSDSGQSMGDNHNAGYSNSLTKTITGAKSAVIIGESDSNLLVQSMQNYRGVDSDGTDSISDDTDCKPQGVRDVSCDSLVEQADISELSVVGHDSSDGSMTATLSCDELFVDGKNLDTFSPPSDSSLHQDAKPDVKSPSHTVSQLESNSSEMCDMEDKSLLQSESVHNSPADVLDNSHQSFPSEYHHASLFPLLSDQVYSSTPSAMPASNLTTPDGQLDLAVAADIVKLILSCTPLQDLLSSNPLCSHSELLANFTSVPAPTCAPVPQTSSTTDATNSCVFPLEPTFLNGTPMTMPKEVTNVAVEGAVEISDGKTTSRGEQQKSAAESKWKRKPKNIPIPKRIEDSHESISTPSTVSSDCTLSSLNSSDERFKAVQLDSPISTFPESLQISVDLAMLPERKKIVQKAKWSSILTTPVRTLRERKSAGKKSTLTVTSMVIQSDRRQQEPRSTPPPSSPPSLVPPTIESRFKVGDVVWSKFSHWDLWPCQIKNHTDIEQAEPGPEQVWVEWYGDHTYSKLDQSTLKPYEEGLQDHLSKKKKKMTRRLLRSVAEVRSIMEGGLPRQSTQVAAKMKKSQQQKKGRL